jgi:hypothetical protein
MTFGFWDSFETKLHGISQYKYTYVGKKILEANQCRSRSQTLHFSLQICGFTICGLGSQGNLRICDLWIAYYKFADLQFANWLTSEIC